MKKQRRGLNRYNMLQDGKKRKKILGICMITLKAICEEKTQEKILQQKTVLTGFEPTSTMKINGS